jgi:L-Ala-D/L-Glu epimerase
MVQLKYWPFDLQLTYTWAIARSTGTTIFKVVLVQLTDDGGTTGLGESAPVSRYEESIETVMAFCGKVDARRLSFNDIAGSMKYLDTVSPGNMAAKCAINIALVDGAARKTGKAVYDFLGLGFKEKKHVTSFSIGIDKPNVIRQKVLAAERYPVLKLKLGGPDDKLNLGSLREAAPKKAVRVDANEGWKTKEHALEMIEWLAKDGHIQFVEQPMPASTSPRDLAWLKQRTPLPIFGDESYQTGADAEKCAECYHGINVKLTKTGGITGAFEALQAARKAGLQTMVGCMIETSILISAAAHLAELTNHLDVDGNILINNDPYIGVSSENGILSFTNAPEKTGLRVSKRSEG